MNERFKCPNCGALTEEGWSFHSGDFNIYDGPLEPDEGHCSRCGFHYSSHVFYPLKEQIAAFRQKRPTRRIDPTTGKVIRERKRRIFDTERDAKGAKP